MNLKTNLKMVSEFFDEYPDLRGSIKVNTRFGYRKILEASITAKNEPVYTIKTKNKKLNGSGKHLLYSDNKWIRINDLNPLEKILTIDGYEEILDVYKTNKVDDLYDLQVDDVKEYYSNGIVSHNSTISDAFFFSLFGETIRELKKDEIVNNINQKKCRVSVDFDVIENGNVDSYRIERKIAPNKLHIEKNGEDITESSMTKSTDRICKIIGATPDVFRNAVIMTVNGTIPFMAQKKVEKRKFCEGLFYLGVFQNMLLEGRQIYNGIAKNIDIENGKINEIKNTEDVYLTQKKRKDEYISSTRKKYLIRQKNNKKELKELEGSIKSISDDDKSNCMDNIKLLEKKKTSIKKLSKKCIIDIATKKEQIKEKTRDIKLLNEFGDMCNKCKRPFSKDDIKEREQKITNINKSISTLEEDILEIDNSYKDHETTIEKCNKAIDKQKQRINEIDNIIDNNIRVEKRINQLKEWNEQLVIDLDILDKDCEEFDEVINQTRKRKESLIATVDELKEHLEIYESIKYIVSEEGVKSFIIKKLLKVLNGKLAYYLRLMDAPCRFKFNEYFEEHIINDKGQECSYNNFSSGERKRIDLAILFTFMDIRRLQGNTSINISFYDEILDTSLDDKGTEMFLNILKERVEKYGESCYIISHKNTAMKSATNDVICLEKKNGFTRIVDIT